MILCNIINLSSRSVWMRIICWHKNKASNPHPISPMTVSVPCVWHHRTLTVSHPKGCAFLFHSTAAATWTTVVPRASRSQGHCCPPHQKLFFWKSLYLYTIPLLTLSFNSPMPLNKGSAQHSQSWQMPIWVRNPPIRELPLPQFRLQLYRTFSCVWIF